MSSEKEYDMNGSVQFEITLDGMQVSFFYLDEATQEYLVEQIRDGCMYGTTGGARLDGHISNGDHAMYNGIPPWAR